MKNITILMAEEPTVVIGNSSSSDSESSNQVQTVAQTAQSSGTAAQTTTRSGGFGMIGMVVYIIVLVGIFYFFAIRPQKKREKEMKSLQESIQVGDEVVTSSGFYGRVIEINDYDMIVEFGINRGVKIKVRKSEIVQSVSKDNDEQK